MGLRQRSAKYREILTEDKDQTTIDRAIAGHHAVTRPLVLRHAKIGTAMLHEHVPFLKGIRIEQQFDTFPRRQPALGVLRRNTFLAAAGACRRSLFFQALQNVLHVLRFPVSRIRPVSILG